MRILTLGILALALGGCATAAEREVARMRDTTERASVVTDSCWSRARAQDGYSTLNSRLSLRYNEPPTLAQRTDASKATPEDRRALSDLHRDWLAPCRKAMIDGAVAILPALQRTMSRYAEREDAIYAGLVEGRLTWGEANTQLVAIRHDMSNGMHEVASQAAQDLRRQHAHELERRAEAMRALGQALSDFADQRIEAERQRQASTPRQTICQNVGGFLSCTTY
jgi:hypothetical protein